MERKNTSVSQLQIQKRGITLPTWMSMEVIVTIVSKLVDFTYLRGKNNLLIYGPGWNNPVTKYRQDIPVVFDLFSIFLGIFLWPLALKQNPTWEVMKKPCLFALYKGWQN